MPVCCQCEHQPKNNLSRIDVFCDQVIPYVYLMSMPTVHESNLSSHAPYPVTIFFLSLQICKNKGKNNLLFFKYCRIIWLHNVHPCAIQMKTAGLRIRVEPGLRDSFLRACQANDLSASQVIRAFMREYIENNKTSLQRSLFDFLEKTQGAATQFLPNESGRQTGE